MSVYPSLPSNDPSLWQQFFADPENPTYEECRSLGFQFLKPGKQCSHPVKSWFRDPRLPKPPHRSRRAILSQLYREHTTAPQPRHDSVLHHYITPGQDSPDPDPAVDHGGDDAQFHLFPLLPAEIRQQIWELALVPRTIDLRELRHDNRYTSIRYASPLPVPHIARVCREARDVVFRLGCRLHLLSANPNAAAAARAGYSVSQPYFRHPVGFVMKGIDIPLYLPDIHKEPEADYHSLVVIAAGSKEEGGSGEAIPVEEGRCTSRAFLKAMKSRTAAVNFSGPSRVPALGRRRHPVATYGTGSSVFATGLLEDWANIKEAAAAAGPKKLDTVYVFHKSRFIDVHLRVDKDFPTEPAEDEPKCKQNWFYEVEMQLLVDLYDDERLAELASLDSLNLDANNNTPRYASPSAANPGLCLNCERVQWEKHVKPEVEALWLQLHEEELGEDPDLLEAVFTGDSTNRPGVPYNSEHPWVKKKLASAPEFRSAVIVHLRIAEEARLRGDFADYEQWADFNSRVQGMR